MTTEDEQQEQPIEQPQIIIINIKEQVRTLINAGTLAEKANRYNKGGNSHRPMIWFNNGSETTHNQILSEYLFRAEKKIIGDMMTEIIEEAKTMIDEELTNIKELLK